ncbi:uncharacterized protein GVI51_L09823 [Nakaseomyces glabratus]|uniref:Uncharacterized protein n=2 Tax=Candida glabrata TaxID=5478 RepID=Q6FKP4_CANGA|nr:uncharacterized protein CAGL0L09845g [Nakaseomyces glabratus]KAH7595687.1 hypothetical protein J7294_04513 [Nakaseomyces glabratus]KAH7602119.1 hypothetical protein J7293_04506 [Nakaseomyces glabratus]KTA96748.1 hypothetical protein AO439_005100 [Nakaseomyces glabratus]KTA98033.1 hypothetical protein AO440_005234 [Nakaseomyces glabratus]KTB06944.1 hypothetical protein AO441_004134 [Nakaseomyces glabratus]|eukprot:XP_449200.1 uncharacterized protein CAGL0L09845g [[Candida] glabrata]
MDDDELVNFLLSDDIVQKASKREKKSRWLRDSNAAADLVDTNNASPAVEGKSENVRNGNDTLEVDELEVDLDNLILSSGTAHGTKSKRPKRTRLKETTENSNKDFLKLLNEIIDKEVKEERLIVGNGGSSPTDSDLTLKKKKKNKNKKTKNTGRKTVETNAKDDDRPFEKVMDMFLKDENGIQTELPKAEGNSTNDSKELKAKRKKSKKKKPTKQITVEEIPETPQQTQNAIHNSDEDSKIIIQRRKKDKKSKKKKKEKSHIDIGKGEGNENHDETSDKTFKKEKKLKAKKHDEDQLKHIETNMKIHNAEDDINNVTNSNSTSHPSLSKKSKKKKKKLIETDEHHDKPEISIEKENGGSSIKSKKNRTKQKSKRSHVNTESAPISVEF